MHCPLPDAPERPACRADRSRPLDYLGRTLVRAAFATRQLTTDPSAVTCKRCRTTHAYLPLCDRAPAGNP